MSFNNNYLLSSNIESQASNVWYRQGDAILHTKNKQGIEKSKTYYISDLLARIFQGEVGVLRSYSSNKQKAYKLLQNDLSKEFELSKKWENKSVGLTIHPKAYFPASKEQDNMIVLHKYDVTLSKIKNMMILEQRVEAICQISQGVATLQSLKIAHNDIKEDNVMYDETLKRYDIIDFGIAETDVEPSKSGDVNALAYLVFMLLDTSEHAGYVYFPPTIQDLDRVGFTQSMQKQVFKFCADIPQDANRIHSFFKSLKNSLRLQGLPAGALEDLIQS